MLDELKKHFALVIVVVILGVVGWLLATHRDAIIIGPPPLAGDAPYVDRVVTPEAVCTTDDCRLRQAMVASDTRGCYGLSSVEMIDVCKRSVTVMRALAQGSEGVCDELDTPMRVRECRAEVFFKRAIESGDVGLCERIEVASSQAGCRAFFIKK